MQRFINTAGSEDIALFNRGREKLIDDLARSECALRDLGGELGPAEDGGVGDPSAHGGKLTPRIGAHHDAP